MRNRPETARAKAAAGSAPSGESAVIALPLDVEPVVGDLELFLEQLVAGGAERRAAPADRHHVAEIPGAQPAAVVPDDRDRAGLALQLAVSRGVPVAGDLVDPLVERVAVGDAAFEHQVRPRGAADHLVAVAVLAAFLPLLGLDVHRESGDLLEDADLDTVDLEEKPIGDLRIGAERISARHFRGPPPRPGC